MIDIYYNDKNVQPIGDWWKEKVKKKSKLELFFNNARLILIFASLVFPKSTRRITIPAAHVFRRGQQTRLKL